MKHLPSLFTHISYFAADSSSFAFVLLQWCTAHGTWCGCCTAQDCVKSWCNGWNVFSRLSETSAITWSLLLWCVELRRQRVTFMVPVNLSLQMFSTCTNVQLKAECGSHAPWLTSCLRKVNVMLACFTCAVCLLFSERELTFTFAICCRPSVCRLSVCRR